MRDVVRRVRARRARPRDPRRGRGVRRAPGGLHRPQARAAARATSRSCVEARARGRAHPRRRSRPRARTRSCARRSRTSSATPSSSSSRAEARHGEARPGRLRVIAGSGRRPAGSSRPPAPATRPTTDRVREAVFSSLGAAAVDGASVLDLYAGTRRAGDRGAVPRRRPRGARRPRPARGRRVPPQPRRPPASPTRGRVVERRRRARSSSGRPPPEAPFDLVSAATRPYDTPDDDARRACSTALAAPGWLRAGRDRRRRARRRAAGRPAPSGVGNTGRAHVRGYARDLLSTPGLRPAEPDPRS